MRCSTPSTRRLLVDAAVMGVRAIYRPGFELAKAGVMLLDLSSSVQPQQSELLWSEPENERDQTKLMSAVDTINARFGRSTIGVASASMPSNTPDEITGDRPRWSMRQERKTPAYTTRWEDVPVARA